MKPKEGTILTVAKAGSIACEQVAESTDDIVFALGEVIAQMNETLDRTPEMLSVLKEAGVVDSGGKGLVVLMEGAYDVLTGKVTNVDEPAAIGAGSAKPNYARVADSEQEITFGYCTEFIIDLEKEITQHQQQVLADYLSSIGDSVVLVSEDLIVKIHVHTNDPGQVLSKALTFGALTSIKIDNMREEHREKLIKDANKTKATTVVSKQSSKAGDPPKSTGFVSVTDGAGFAEIFNGLNVDEQISGGQTMNPSTEDLLSAIEKVNASTVFLLPNNPNIILAAKQAADMTKDKKVIVIPSKNIPQGISALINYAAGKSPEENEAFMTKEMQRFKTGQVTVAVRDTAIDGKAIRKGNIIGIRDGSIEVVGDTIADTTYDFISLLTDKDSELVSIYYGDGIEKDEAELLASRLSDRFPDVDVEAFPGGQSVYYYIFSVE
jgi:DAK2 domain fusion protein YloV